MTEKKVKRLVVVDQGQRLTGMVDRESILRIIAG
jgi:predicted transcriptional regulator